MLYGYIGDEAFRSGMQHYLTKFAYSNTETGDLWACLEESSKKPIDKIMSTW
jgi:puromycin-sensitive aminopeptidase